MEDKAPSRLRFGFVLMPRFTLTAVAGFVDALRLAADEGDRSRQRLCAWDILGPGDTAIASSCGAEILTTAPLEDPERYDYIVVVGGLLHGGQKIPARIESFLRDTAAAGKGLVGLCTGSFVLARAGLLDGYLACVSWFHREEFESAFPSHRVVSNQMFVVDRDRMTCAGGTSVVHLAAVLIERAIGRGSAVKALRIMIEEQPMPARTLQPEAVLSVRSRDSVVHRAMLLIEQALVDGLSLDDLAARLGLSRRQLERRFLLD
jgi:transcriptional regulator GlxA family with amidase domain